MLEMQYFNVLIEEVGVFEDVFGLLECDGEVDLVFLDLIMFGMCGFFGFMYLCVQFVGVLVVVVLVNEDL